MENRDVTYFDELWAATTPKDGMKHTKETWDRMADMWKKNPSDVEEAKNQICYDICAYLKERDILRSDSVAIDIGCGTGNYAVQFAKDIKHVTCVDISPKMLDMAKENALKYNVDNLDYVDGDFLEMDIKEKGWKNKYDLVFTSLSPAMNGLKSIEKINSICKGWGFNNSFVYRKDALRNAVMRDLYGMPITNKWGNSSVYCLFNILWQLGYMPEMRYYKETISHEYMLDMDTAMGVAQTVIKGREPDEKEVKRIYDYLAINFEKDGKVVKTTESVFAWTLWNVSETKC